MEIATQAVTLYPGNNTKQEWSEPIRSPKNGHA